MSSRQKATLDSICSLIADCPHSTPVWTDSGFLVIRNQNIKGGKLDLSERSYTDLEHYLIRVRRAKPQTGDLIMTREAPMGDVCMVPDGLECCVGQRQVLLRPNPEKVISRFLLYAIQSPEVQNEISWSEGTGSTVSNIRIPVLKSIKIPLLPLEEQAGISTMLGALDDRIELLRETNTTLEAIAQALFKSWFVDFDPVHAKQQGLEPEGMDADTVALFPDSFEESELGLVPRGWNILSFTDTVKVIGGGTPKTSIPEFWDGSIPWFSVVDAPVITNVFVIDTTKHISEYGLNNSSTKLLPEGTTIISARGTVGRLALVGRKMAMNQSCYGLRGKADDDYFTYFSTYRLVEALKQRSHGSVFNTITTETMKGVYVIYPDAKAIHAFETVLSPVMIRIKTNLEQAQTLATLRDTLLPRLISGQLRLPEATALLEEPTA